MKKPQWMIIANALGFYVETGRIINRVMAHEDYERTVSVPFKVSGARYVKLMRYGIEPEILENPTVNDIGRAMKRLLDKEGE